MASAVTCSACGKTYASKPEYAGRKLKCKCGAMIAVPQVEDETYDISEPEEAAPMTKSTAAPLRSVAPVVPPARSSTPAPRYMPTSSSSGRGTDAGERSAAGKIGAGILGVLVLLSVGVKLLRIAFHRNESTPSNTSVAAMPATNAHDEFAKRLMATDQMVPMSQWFTSPPKGKMLGGYSMKQAESLYREKWLKQLGVTEVFVSNRPMSMVVVFQLPAAPAARAAIYQWQVNWQQAQQMKPTQDTGGDFLLVNIPLVKPG